MDILQSQTLRLKNIKQELFYTHPLLFSVACLNNFVPNSQMDVCLRVGISKIEFNPELCKEYSEQDIKDLLKIELFRILLLHPYSRKPENVRMGVLFLASDICLYQAVIKNKREPLINNTDLLKGVQFFKNCANIFRINENPLGKMWQNTEELAFFKRNLIVDFQTNSLMLVDNLSFEAWYEKIMFLITQISIAGSVGVGQIEENLMLKCEQSSQLWQQNEQSQNEIKEQIASAQISNTLDGLGDAEKRLVTESVDFSFDYRRALSQFRQSIISPKRSLTRMKPSRRYGFSAMGSRYERKAKVLIAVDVSGSISELSYNNFCCAIKNFFFLKIIEQIDMIFFDVNLKFSKPVVFTNHVDFSNVVGGGGTNFQIPLDYYNEHKNAYNGMIIFTDGEGDVPKVSVKSNILWILDSLSAYKKHVQWINSLTGNKATFLYVNE